MGEVKHLCLVRFKEGVVSEDILRELTDVAAGIDAVTFFGWGEDTVSPETLTQGFTHVLPMAFATAEDMAAFMSHEKHAAFAPTFMAAVDKLLVIGLSLRPRQGATAGATASSPVMITAPYVKP